MTENQFADETKPIFSMMIEFDRLIQFPKRLDSNKLTLDIKKFQNIDATAIEDIKEREYLGIIFNHKLCFVGHINLVITKLSRQYGIVSKLRHYTPVNWIILYNSSNIKSKIQHELLAYAYTNYN